jgi:glycosyltransferase involved in cell wall biosynthesis
MNQTVLLLSSSHAAGGGIERYLSTIEGVFTEHDVPYRRIDLVRPDRPNGIGAKLSFLAEVRRAVRSSPGPTRLVLMHCHLLPAVRLVAGLPNYAGTTVILHGGERYPPQRIRGRRAMRRANIRVAAVSDFLAGALCASSHAKVLHPGVSREWYHTLVAAGGRPRPDSGEINLVTAFRFDAWRDKGLGTLLQAIRLVGDDRVRLTVCGSGAVPAELRSAVAPYPWCRLVDNPTDHLLAEHFAGADLFVLATCVRRRGRMYGESFGFVLLEAQLAGTPVVAPPYGGSFEAFQDGLTGLATLDETPESLAGVLASLIADHARRAEMGRAAAAWARTRFEPTAYGRHMVDTLVGHRVARVEVAARS